jgi:hypothetical protein
MNHLKAYMLTHCGRQGRRLRFASGGIIMASAVSLKMFLLAGGGMIHPETAKLAMLE